MDVLLPVVAIESEQILAATAPDTARSERY
jgi:hypothetical protein